MDKISEALRTLGRDYLIHADLIEPIRTGSADILYADGGCVLLKDKLSGVYMIAGEDLALAEKLLLKLPAGETHVVAHSDPLLTLCTQKLGYTHPVPCYQAVFRGGPFELSASPLRIRPMREEEAEIACEMYFRDREDALYHIRRGLVYAGCEGERIAAMIGMHLQGAMGLLVVSESSRRRGYGEVMEKFLINTLLERGLVPYCHVVEGNEPSLSLQRKLGLEISRNMLYWLRKE